MALTKEDLQAIAALLQPLKDDIDSMKDDMSGIKDDMSDMKNDIKRIQLHLENKTDPVINLLAENHENLVNKLNEAIPVANKNLIYEVKVTNALARIEKLEDKIKVLESRIA